MEPLLTVNCITYNHASYVKNALDGFLMQRTNFPFKVVVHDDASTDGTQDIIREYERAYPDIFDVIYQKENQYSKTNSLLDVEINCIVPKYRGKYLAVCEGDDYWFDPNKLQMQFDYMEAHPNCSCTFHPVVWLDESNGDRVYRITQTSPFEMDYAGEEVIAPGPISYPTCSRVVRTDIITKYPTFRRIADIGDLPSKLLLAANGYFHYFPNVMGVYRWNHPVSWNYKFRNDRSFAVKSAIIGLQWTYEFNLYSKNRFAVSVGKVMLYHILLKLDALDAVNEFPWLVEILIEATAKKDKMLELEQLAKKSKNNKIINEKHKEAEKEYYSWLIEAIGEGLKKQGLRK